VDGLIEGLQRLIDKKKLVKQGAMQALLTGKTRLPGFRGEWVSHTLESFVSLRKLRVNPRLLEQSKFCIELEHIEPASGRLISSSTTNQQSSLKSVFKSGDILFGKLRAYLRKYWQADREGLCSTEFWVFLTNTATLNSSYFFQVVKTDAFIDVASSSYGTHMPRSDWNVVKEYEIRIPPLEEQEAIATTLSDMDAEIEALEAKLAKYRQIKQGMMQELLTGKTRLVEPSQGA
jgi:type I restriction enzyme S subunit